MFKVTSVSYLRSKGMIQKISQLSETTEEEEKEHTLAWAGACLAGAKEMSRNWHPVKALVRSDKCFIERF